MEIEYMSAEMEKQLANILDWVTDNVIDWFMYSILIYHPAYNPIYPSTHPSAEIELTNVKKESPSENPTHDWVVV